MTDKTSGAGPSEFQAGAAFVRDRGADLRRAMTSQRARHVWTGAVALAVTGGVLVSASASVPVPGTATSASASGSTSAAASGSTSTAASAAPSGTTSADGASAAARIPGQAAPTGTDGVTIRQVLAVLDRAEHRLRQGASRNPYIAQAAAELGMLYTTYRAQQLALDGADEQAPDEQASDEQPQDETPASGPAGTAEAPAGATSPVLRFVTKQPPAVAPAVSRPSTERRDSDHVTFDEVAVAAMRLANLLDPTSPTALIETLPDAEPSLRRSLQETVAAYGDSTAGYANGRIPADVLCPLPFAPGHMLRCDAAERLTALSAEFEKEFGYPIPLTDSYRPYAMQVAVKGTKPHLAAIPGTSNHGWGLAIDLDDPIAGGSSPEYVWLRLHAPDYGWDNPSWARLGGAKPEPWHFEFFAAGAIPNRAIDPSDVGTWAPYTATSDDEGGPDVVPASARTPGEASAPSDGSDRPAGTDHAAGSGADDADGGAPAADDGSSSEPADPTPSNPEPAKPAPAKPAPSDPPTQDEDAPADTGVVGAVVDDTVELVDGTVDGVVGGLVSGLLGTD